MPRPRPGWLILALTLTLTTLPGHAQEQVIEHVRLAPQTRVDGQALVLNGAGLRRYLGFDVYVAARYLPHAMREVSQVLSRDTPRRLEVTLLRDTTTEQNLDALMGGMEDNNPPEELEALQAQTDRFFSLIRTVHEIPEGTRITLDYLPGSGTRLSIAGRVLGTIPGERFNRAIMKIWLGDNPIQLSLKKALLGQTSS